MCTHCLYNIGFDNVFVHGERYFFAAILRSFFTCCVPLFFMLSGYLMKNKTPTWNYYSKSIRLLILYFVSGVLSILFLFFVQKKEMSVKDVICYFTDFGAVGYGWYLRAYIGLFIFIPFLNIMIHALKNKKQFQILILSFILVISVPTFLNSLTLRFSNYWKDFYPIIYYLLGAYVSLYKPQLRKSFLALSCGVLTISSVVILFIFRHGQQRGGGVYLQYGDLIFVLITVTVFLFLYQVKAPRSRFLCRFITSVSRVSYTMFLISWIYDQTIYKYILNPLIPSFYDRIFFTPIPIIIVFFLSYFTALFFEGSYDFGSKKFSEWRKKQKAQ